MRALAAPAVWLECHAHCQIPCDGRLLQIAGFEALFAVIGTTYGGDGVTTFAVPDMRGRNAVGTGTPPGGSDAVVLGEVFGTESTSLSVANLPVSMGGSGTAVQNYGPSLGLTYLIATSGVFPSRDGGGGEEVYLGEMILFSGNFAPNGFLKAEGQLLPIAQNQALFALLGIQYGGNGSTTFALPDMRGRSPANSGDFSVGTQFGTQTYTVGIEEFGPLVLNGTIGSDSYYGANQADIINGNNGDDVLFGNGGADQINGGIGADAMNGGAGNDTFAVDNAGDTVVGGADSDRVNVAIDAYDTGDDVEEIVYTGAGTFTTRTGNNDNVITGGALGDTIKARGGNDTLNGGGGNDDLNGGAGTDTMNGGEGNDTLRVDNAGDIANGGNGSDTVLITAAISFNASANADVETFENTSGGNVTVTMNALDNLYGGGTGIDTVNGGGGIDNIFGYAGADVLNGDAGNDRLFGDIGNDMLNGGADNDVLEGGTDTDTLTGGSGDDTLYGQDGADTLTGGSGIDYLSGGIGADRFAFASGDSGNTLATADRIVDFSTAQGDRIDLSAINATASASADKIGGDGAFPFIDTAAFGHVPGQLRYEMIADLSSAQGDRIGPDFAVAPTDGAFSFIGTAAFSNVAGQLRYELIGGSTYVMGDTNGDSVADIVIKLDGSVVLAGSDFML